MLQVNSLYYVEQEKCHIHLTLPLFPFAEDKVKLWSLSFNESIFHLWREDVLEIKPDFKDKEEFLQQTIRFYWSFKVCKYQPESKKLVGFYLAFFYCIVSARKHTEAIQNLHTSHKENLNQARYSASPELVNPSIVRLTEKEHSKGMAGYGPFDSPEHD